MSWRGKIGRDQRGQATVGFVAILPFVMLLALVLLQAGMVGYAAWASANSARAGARAAHVGDIAEDAARAALPTSLRDRARVRTTEEGIEVQVRAAKTLPGLGPFKISGGASLGEGS